MIDPIILRQKVSKWYEALRYLKENQSQLSPQELTAIEDLQDKWRNGSFDDDMVEEATDMVQILIDSTKYHGNNREIIRWSKEFVGIARDMYTRDAETFKQYYEALGGAAKTHSQRMSTSEVTIGGGHRETVPPPPPGPSIEVYEVTFRNTDYDNNVLSEGDPLPSTSQYINPIVEYRSASRRKCRVGYRVYNSNGEFLGDKESGYTSILDCEPYEDGKLTFAGWGNKAGTFWTPGKYRVEIYCDEVKIYETSFSVTPAAPQQPAKPTVTLISAEFENMTINGDRISTNLPYNTQFVCPRIRFKTTGTIHSFEVQYMVYNAAGQRMTANPQKTKVTDIKAGVDYLNSYGSTDGKYWKAGTYKVEFTSEYGGSLTSYFTIPPVPHSVPSSVSSTENKKGCSRYWWVLLIAGALWLMPKGCMSCGSNKDAYSDESDVLEEAVVEEVVETPTPKPRKKAEPVETAVSEMPVEPVEESVESVSADDYVNDFMQETPQVDYNKPAEEPDYNAPAEEPDYNAPAEDNKIYTVVEQKPVFPGGDAELMKWLSSHIKYPSSAAENGIQGAVVVEFVVYKDGSIGDVRIRRSRDEALDKEAIRVVRSLPRFIPGKMNGQPVNVWYTLPVTFRLR